MPQNIFKDVGDWLADFIGWVKETLADEMIRREIATDLGLAPGAPVPAVNIPPERMTSIERYRSQANPDKEAFFILLSDVRQIYEALSSFVAASGVSGVTAHNEALYRVFDLLALNYVRLYEPKMFFALQLASALIEDSSVINKEEADFARLFKSIGQIIALGCAPLYYLPRSLFGAKSEEEARRISDKIFPHLAGFLVSGLGEDIHLKTNEVIYGWDNSPHPDDKRSQADTISQRMFSAAFTGPIKDETTGTQTGKKTLNVSLAIVPATTERTSALFASLGGAFSHTTPLSERWKLAAEISTPTAVSLFIHGIKQLPVITGPQDLREVRIQLALTSQPDKTSNLSFVLPNEDGTRIEIGQLTIAAALSADRAELKATAQRCALVLASKDADGFIASLLPDDGLHLQFNFGFGYATGKGFYTEGNVPFLSGHSTRRSRNLVPENLPGLSAPGNAPPGLEQVIPVGKTLGPMTIKQLLLALLATVEPNPYKATLEAATSLIVRFGPVEAIVDRLGFQLHVGFPETGGNAGFADFGIGLRLPTGVGLKVESPAVTGGGFLALHAETGQYAGVVELQFSDGLAIKAIGLLSTRLPDNTKGFSLLVIITAEGFRPIPLGLGFVLTGIGGLLAINRTCNEEALRAGLKNGALDHVLFPQDPIRNAPQMLSQLNTLFPPRRGNHLFGPAVRIAWGTPPLITMELALILEFGQRLRLLVLGQISMILPKPDNDLVRIQMDAFGVLDFDQKTAALDATLHHSRLLHKFTLTGDMALRLSWGASPSFALAVGGFHPAFKAPSGFPKLERIALSLADSEDLRIRCEAYFALTSNTVQFGARAELFAKKAGFSIHGEIGFDVLIQFDPFSFLAEFYASVQLKRGSTNLFKVKVSGALAGPRPLHVRGKATFEIFWWDLSISFDRTLVSGERPPLPAPINVAPLLKAALSDARNWGNQITPAERKLVTLRPTATAGQLDLHPLGTLTVRQSVVPLDRDISRFGQTTPSGARRFQITSVQIGTQTQLHPLPAITEQFAPAQFFELSDADKLSSPSFEPMKAGVHFGSEELAFAENDGLEFTLDYETRVFNLPAQQAQPASNYVLSSAHFPFGSIGVRAARHTGSAKFSQPGRAIEVRPTSYVIASTEDLSLQPLPGVAAGTALTWSEAWQGLRQLRRENPRAAQQLQLIRQTA